jgi:hypothetical protein
VNIYAGPDGLPLQHLQDGPLWALASLVKP